MNFYTLISNNTLKPKRWIYLIFLFTFLSSLFIILFNFIIDPYNITKYNLLDIKYKFARDDRTEKINYFKTINKVDNILIGSSRVYSINPKIVSDILGGTTDNFGVGTATVEDHLGIIKYLVKEKKVPKNIIIGVDFYTFNPQIPPNSYFLKNKELNFLSYSNYDENYISKLFSFDSFRASVKTLKVHLKNSQNKPRFDKNGWAGSYEDYSKRDTKLDLINTKKELLENIKSFLSNLNYSHIDKKRIQYYEEIRNICITNNIKLYIFNTPLHPILLQELELNLKTKQALKEFIQFMSTFENFKNLYYNKLIYKDIRNFHGTTHTSTNCGDIILKELFTEGFAHKN